jgi:hypothetical protein
MHFFIAILLAAFPVTLAIPMMFTVGYFQENDSGTRVAVRHVGRNKLRLALFISRYFYRRTCSNYGIIKTRKEVQWVVGMNALDVLQLFHSPPK